MNYRERAELVSKWSEDEVMDAMTSREGEALRSLAVLIWKHNPNAWKALAIYEYQEKWLGMKFVNAEALRLARDSSVASASRNRS